MSLFSAIFRDNMSFTKIWPKQNTYLHTYVCINSWVFNLGFRVARWYLFKLKILCVLAKLLGACNGRGWFTLRPFGIYYSRLVYFIPIWYIFWLFGIFFPFWYVLARNIWQPCLGCVSREKGAQYILTCKKGFLRFLSAFKRWRNHFPAKRRWGVRSNPASK
jgi:hypothetical protein